MKKHVSLSAAALCILYAAFFFAAPAAAEIRHELLKDIALDDTPQDITFSRDGSTVYILGQKTIMVYSAQQARVTDTIPLSGAYSQIALSPDESTLYLTAADAPKVSVVKVALVKTIETGSSPVIGNPKAAVTLTAFLDFQCPYCAKVYPTLKELLAKYPQDLRLVIKHYPLPMHKSAEKAALASLAAARQNQYEKVSELFFANFSKLNDTTIRQYVQEAGLNMEQYDKDLQSPELKNILKQDLGQVREAGVRAVPTLFINGIIPKSRSLDALSQMVQEELQRKK